MRARPGRVRAMVPVRTMIDKELSDKIDEAIANDSFITSKAQFVRAALKTYLILVRERQAGTTNTMPN